MVEDNGDMLRLESERWRIHCEYESFARWKDTLWGKFDNRNVSNLDVPRRLTHSQSMESMNGILLIH
jgi:hypothetical protein